MRYYRLQELFVIRNNLEELEYEYVPKKYIDIALNKIEKDIKKYILETKNE